MSLLCFKPSRWFPCRLRIKSGVPYSGLWGSVWSRTCLPPQTSLFLFLLFHSIDDGLSAHLFTHQYPPALGLALLLFCLIVCLFVCFSAWNALHPDNHRLLMGEHSLDKPISAELPYPHMLLFLNTDFSLSLLVIGMLDWLFSVPPNSYKDCKPFEVRDLVSSLWHTLPLVGSHNVVRIQLIS